MSDFDELYNAFIRTAPAKNAIAEIKQLHPEISAKDAAQSAKIMAEMAYNLGYMSYFNPEIKEGSVSKNWNQGFRRLNSLSLEVLQSLKIYSEVFADKIMPTASSESEEALYRNIFAQSAKAMLTYAPDKLGDKKLQNIMIKAVETITNPNNGLSLRDKFPLSMSAFSSLYEGDSKSYFNKLKILTQALPKLKNPKDIMKFGEEIDNSYQNEGKIDDVMAQGFVKNVVPFANKHKDFSKLVGEHDCAFGEYGLMGYNILLQTSRWTPLALNQALGVLKEVPTPDMQKRETIRTQAITLENANFTSLRDFIHSENVGTTELVKHMLDYYQAHQSSDIKSKTTAEERIKKDLKQLGNDEFLSTYLDISRYDEVVDKNTNQTAVQTLEIIAANMEKENTRPPLSGDLTLDKLSQDFMLDGYTNTKQYGVFLSLLNHKIIQNIEEQKIGISPQMVDLLHWCDQKNANILKNRDFEQQCGDYKSDWFKQVALFAELTNSAEERFNLKGFEAYYSHIPEQSYFFDAHNILLKRQRNNIFKLFARSKADQQKATNILRKKNLKLPLNEQAAAEERLANMYDQRRRRMVSGNLISEMFKLNDFKKPSTRMGERHAADLKHLYTVERPVEKTLLKLFKAGSKEK